MLDQQRQIDAATRLCPTDPKIEMLKIVIEVLEDHTVLQKDMLALKTAIKDGSSLLYDLLPTYLSINMGHSGLATSNDIKNC